MRSLSHRSFFLVSFALLFGLGATWALTTPRIASPDEDVQAVRAAGAVRGYLGGEMVVTPSPGPGLANSADYEVEIPKSYVDLLPQAACYAFQPDVTAECAPELSSDDTPTTATTYVGSYQPTYYVLTGLPSLFLPGSTGLYAMRIVSVLIGATFLALGLVAARFTGGGLLLAAAGLAATPGALFFIGSVNPSGAEIAAGFAAWLTGLAVLRATGPDPSSEAEPVDLARRAPTWLIVGFTISIAALIAIRPLGAGIAIIIVGGLLVFFVGRQRARAILADRRCRAAAATIVAVGVAVGAWILWAKSFGAFKGIPHPELTTQSTIRLSLEALPGRYRQMIGQFGWVDTETITSSMVTWTACLAVLTVAGLVLGTWRQRLAMVCLGLGVLVVPPLADLQNFQLYGLIWQGRYMWPFAMGIPILAGVVVADRLRSRRLVAVASAATAIVISYGFMAGHVASMRRYGTGVHAGVFDYLGQGRWEPRAGSWPLLVATVVLASAWGVWLYLAATGGPIAGAGPGADAPIAPSIPGGRSRRPTSPAPDAGSPVPEAGPRL